MASNEIVTGRAGAPFVLLEDFWQAYDLFVHKLVGIDDALRLRVVEPMRKALSRSVPALRVVDSDDLAHGLTRIDGDAHFVITMDGGTFFREADFSIEITRATHRIDRVSRGSFFRLARAGRPLLHQQGIQAAARYEQDGQDRPIVLCDDGIGTGRSVRSILDIMSDLQLAVTRIYVLVNPARLTNVGGVEVVTLVDTPADVLWLSERDLYWGLPRSGISLTPTDICDTTWGVPYTADLELVETRIGLSGQPAIDFRAHCLALNREFWSLLEQHHNQHLVVDECPRLSFFAEQLGLSGTRIVDLLDDIASEDFQLGALVQQASSLH